MFLNFYKKNTMKKSLYLISFLIFLIISCNNTEEPEIINDLNISGSIQNVPPNTYISLIHRTSDNTVVLDSMLMIDSTFELSADISDKIEFYTLKLTNNYYYIYLLADSGSNIIVNADYKNLPLYKVENSHESQQIQQLENKLLETNTQISSFYEHNPDENRIEEVKNEQREFSLDFISKNAGSMACIIALSERFVLGDPVLPIEDYYEVHKEVEKKLRENYLESEYYLQFSEFIKNYEINLNRETNIDQNNENPAELVNFSAKTLDGNDFELKSLSGQWILLNFWASWSVSCVENNQLLRKISKSHPEINIVQISIDKYEEVARDTLNNYNFNHIMINETNSWDSEIASLYNIESLPTNIIINSQGKIVLFSNKIDDLQQYMDKF